MKPYATLTDAEKWNWHAEVYAFRRIVLDAPIEEKTSPCDPDGKWFHEDMIRAAAVRLQAKRQDAYRRRDSMRSAELIAKGRAICNRWARDYGYADFAEAERDGKKHTDVIRSITGPRTMPIAVRHTANHYGATATEWTPAPERLARDLSELQRRGDVQVTE